ncbi:hypothetical protein KGY79_12100, partial [Candidatus Bipolaricaulota bacterium]|nr:hypothetical protein [Candidatus Bipolaricaulota bacterium]
MSRKFFSFSSGLGEITNRKPKIKRRYIYFFALLSIGTVFAVYYLPLDNNLKLSSTVMRAAAEKMKKGEKVIKDSRRERGSSINSTFDPNQTGLIGEEYTKLTTTLG